MHTTVDPTRPPATPAVTGTYTLARLGARYTIGAEHVAEPALRLAALARPLVVDIETEGTGAAAMHVKCVTLGTTDHAVVLDPRDPAQALVVRMALATAQAIAMHNAPFDAPVLVRRGLMELADLAKVWDTLVWARLGDPGERSRHDLASLASQHLGRPRGRDMLTEAFAMMGLTKSEGYRVFDLNRPVYIQGAVTDVVTTARVFPLVRRQAWQRLTEGHPFTRWGVQGDEAAYMLDREQRINRVFMRRAVRGLRVDLAFLDEYRDELGPQLRGALDVLDGLGLDTNKPAGMAAWLDAQGLTPPTYPRTKTGQASTEAKHLARIDHPVVAAYLAAKRIAKIQNDYLQKVVDNADSHDRVHATTSILGASATGRMSMSNPPLQQFPERARGIILADEGDAMTSIDWSQIEPVIAANLANDVAALAGYESGESDLYTDIAAYAGIDRKAAKVTLLAQLYGEGLDTLAADLRSTTAEAELLRQQVFAAMPRVAAMINTIKADAREHRMVQTLSGRVVPVPMSTYEGRRSVAAHKAVNYTIQGSAYDLLAEAVVRIDEAGLGDGVYLAMHDELVVSREIADQVQAIMTEPPERLCRRVGRRPVLRTDRAELGERWAAA